MVIYNTIIINECVLVSVVIRKLDINVKSFFLNKIFSRFNVQSNHHLVIFLHFQKTNENFKDNNNILAN